MKNLKYRILLCLILPLCLTQAWADPPGRVGRIAYVEGSVDFHDLASDETNPAAINWPITSNTMITTEDRSRAELRVGPAAVRLDEDSELQIVRLDEGHLVLQLNQGAVIVHARDSRLADEFELDTPKGRILLNGPSDLRVDVNDSRDTSTVQVFSGQARYDDADSGLTISAGRRAEISHGGTLLTQIHADGNDFDEWSMARDEHEEASTSVRYVSPETTGYEELDRYGNWETTVEYGTLWYPRTVPVGWAPYRVGRWVWVQPWGWTWVDSAPWGYAPSHYGRWVWYGHRWCWAPGTRVAQPVWAPALVGWVGGRGWSASVSTGGAPTVGWFPLAPHEVYVPSYAVSPTYIRQINMTHVNHIDNIRYVNGRANVPMRGDYRNRGLPQAVTVVPHDRFQQGGNVILSAQPAPNLTRQAWQNAPVSATVPPSIVRQSFDENNDRRFSHRHGSGDVSAPRVLPAPTMTVVPSSQVPASAPIEPRRRIPDISSQPQVTAPLAPSYTTTSPAAIPHERHWQPGVSPNAPAQAPVYQAPQMQREQPAPRPEPVQEERRFPTPFSGVQPGSGERARMQEMPGNREVRPAPASSQPSEAGHRNERPERGQPSEEERRRHEQQDPWKR